MFEDKLTESTSCNLVIPICCTSETHYTPMHHTSEKHLEFTLTRLKQTLLYMRYGGPSGLWWSIMQTRRLADLVVTPVLVLELTLHYCFIALLNELPETPIELKGSN